MKKYKDLVVVTRCKDCKYAYKSKDIYYCYELTGFSEIVESDFFCKYGERKADE